MLFRAILLGPFVALLLALTATEPANAQYSGSSARSIYSATRNMLYNRPTVSPYVNLATRNSSGGLPNYYTMVRPQVEQRERDVANQRQSAQLQHQISQVQEQVRQSQAQAEGMLITGRVGWSSRGLPRFGSYLNFYPGFQAVARR